MLFRSVLHSGRMSGNILKKSIVHFKQLRSLELSVAISMRDFSLWEVLGTLPSLENLTLETYDLASASHPPRVPENSNNQRGLRYFDALESLDITGSFFIIQHLLRFIDSPCLKSIKLEAYPVRNEHEPEDLLTSSMTVFASKWLQSLKNLTINLNPNANGITYHNSTLFMELHEIQTFQLVGGRMENNNDAVRCLAMSWPKLRTLAVMSFYPPNQVFISISTLRIIAENCPDLRCLEIQLDISTIPPFDDHEISSKSLRHNLEFLDIQQVAGPDNTPQTMLEFQIDVARHLDLIFPYLKTIEVQDRNWLGICSLVKLCQKCQDTRRGR